MTNDNHLRVGISVKQDPFVRRKNGFSDFSPRRARAVRKAGLSGSKKLSRAVAPFLTPRRTRGLAKAFAGGPTPASYCTQ